MCMNEFIDNNKGIIKNKAKRDHWKMQIKIIQSSAINKMQADVSRPFSSGNRCLVERIFFCTLSGSMFHTLKGSMFHTEHHIFH